MKNYCSLVSRKPPEGLLDWALQGRALSMGGFVYEKIWDYDMSMVAILEDRTRKKPWVVGKCSECGQTMRFEYIPKERIYKRYNPVYGFWGDLSSDEAIVEGDEWECPCCGERVKVFRASSAGYGFKTTDEYYVTSAEALEGEAGKRPLVLTQWRIQRQVNRNADEKYEIEPVEAYVFEEKDACWLRGWVKAYSGTVGYYIALKDEWSQPRDWKDEMGTVGRIFGLTEELVEESCLYNSKLDLFMNIGVAKLNPVAYLRLYQKYPQVENLVVQGCGHIIARIFEEMEQNEKWQENKRGLIQMPPELHLEEKRPAQMLGLNKDEMRVMVEQRWDLYHWRVYIKAKAAGDRMELPGDIVLLHQYGAEDVEKIIGKEPVSKCLRYLMKQIERMGRMIEETDPYGECDEDTLDLLSASHLSDYWDMAKLAGWDLNDPEVRWPKNLIDAHDRAMVAGEAARDKQVSRLIRERARELKDFIYVSGELVIFPAGSQCALNKEGGMLHHCVAGYGKDIAAGITAIFFIRHTWDPKVSYFTLEYKNGKVEQNRGLRNCRRTKEVEEFEKEWLAWIAKGRPRDKEGHPVGAKPAVKERPEMLEKKEDHVA